LDEIDGDPDLEDSEGQTRVTDRGRYLFDRKQRGRGRRKGRAYAGMTEDDEDNGDAEDNGDRENEEQEERPCPPPCSVGPSSWARSQ
jgi:hypothetical protein